MADALSIAELVRQRSMLVILIAACESAQTAFQAADNIIDSQLLEDLTRMIERSRGELSNLTDRIASVSVIPAASNQL